MERSDGNDDRNRVHPEDRLHDTSLPPNVVNMADQQQQQQQDTSPKKIIIGRELQHFIMSRVGVNGKQRQAYKFRLLNKNAKERVEKGINEAKVNIRNIEGLAGSQLSNHIQNLEVFIKGALGFQNFPVLSTVHFKSTKNINLIITGRYDSRIVQLNIQEHLILSNIYFTNKSNLDELRIQGKYEVEIRDCTFSSLLIRCYKNAQVSVVNSRFLNTGGDGFICQCCDSLLMDQITIKDCRWHGYTVCGCGNVRINNIQVVSCGGHGIYIWQVNGFKLRNAFVQGCVWSGICVGVKSVGEIQSAHVQGCSAYGIQVWGKSKVRYAQIQCDNNKKGEFRIKEDCEFLRMN